MFLVLSSIATTLVSWTTRCLDCSKLLAICLGNGQHINFVLLVIFLSGSLTNCNAFCKHHKLFHSVLITKKKKNDKINKKQFSIYIIIMTKPTSKMLPIQKMYLTKSISI